MATPAQSILGKVAERSGLPKAATAAKDRRRRFSAHFDFVMACPI
jgi:hypothetical protein